jgi:peptidoglycan/xylan/chitin deacetylase (PgdA/CDA1 family)
MPAPRVTLTFDNGPDPTGTTTRVLDILKDRGVSASFFVTGAQLAAPGARSLAKRARREGHWIGNHTFSHSVMFGDSDDPGLPDREIGATQQLIGDLAGPERFFRPYGAGGLLGPRLLSAAAVDHLVAGGYSLVLWNCVPRDWEPGEGWVDRCLDDVTSRDWTLVVLHDLPEGGAKLLPRLLDRLEAMEAELVQSFPDSCLPIRRGHVHADLTGLMTA